ncbi:uncharacterized protein A1O9_04464 [Exophiala aquamarina CBS 119918]|uniref:Palmitoyltransferase n=1 Tax=Exophiala aquamarina CBS 119918 TaxID=1182545 RepID=A0A072PJW3_9EURO|nr:uncharacterized protein A1O9_04464 [Exophiala aquamarina CBS 119918]KEF59618.1 hypothetical protein A1O9_04464 [Exophiala aquamarina CBS 119918]
MGIVRTIAIIILSISFVVFVALFGRLPALRRTPIAFLHKLLWHHVPNAVIYVDDKITGRRFTRGLARTGNYLLNDAHPIVLVFFVTLQVVGELLFIPSAWSRLSTWQALPIPFLVAAPYWFLYLSSTTSSNITHSSHRKAMLAYPYDYCLFHPGYYCSTCRFPKPARSKHCSLCKACIEKQDHHCIWINNCVGRNNYIWFNLLLLTITALLAYGATLGYTLLDARLQERLVPAALTRGSVTAKRWSTRLTWSQWANMWAWAISVDWQIGAVMMLSAMSCPLSLSFLLYHVYLMWAGMTTNESAKWADWKDDVQDNVVWRAEIQKLRETYPRLPPDVEPEDDLVQWPREVRAKWWMVRTRDGDQPTLKKVGSQIQDDSEVTDVPDERWERIQSMREVDNLYDRGFWMNLVDGMFNRG